MSVTTKLIENPNAAAPGRVYQPGMFTLMFQIAPAGNYAGVPGDPMDLTAMTAPPGETILTGLSQGPVNVTINSQNPAGASGYHYKYIPNVAPPNNSAGGGFFQVLQGANAAPDADIGAGAYPAGVLADTIIATATFLRG